MTVFIAPGPMLVKASIGLAGGPVVAVGEMDGRLLVHDLDRPDRVLPVEEGVGDRPAAVAGDAGGERHALADEVLDEDLGAGRRRDASRRGRSTGKPLALRCNRLHARPRRVATGVAGCQRSGCGPVPAGATGHTAGQPPAVVWWLGREDGGKV